MTAEPSAGEEPDQVVQEAGVVEVVEEVGLVEVVQEVARGVAAIPKPPPVRAVVAVPGSLSVPRKPPRSWPRLASRAMVFPRRGDPMPTAREFGQDPVPVRLAAPSDDHPVLVAGGDGAPGVRNKVLLRRLALPAVAAALAAFTAGTGYLAVTAGPPGLGDVGRWGAVPVTAPADVSRPAGDPFGGDPFASVVAKATGAPTRLRIKEIGVDTALEQLDLGSDGALRAPKTFGRAGWYADGTAPGDNGPAVLAGHVDSKSGPAVFYRLRELTTGDRIEVVRGGAVLPFTVTRTAWYPKTKFPTGQVYGPTPDRQLRLITCGGVFDRSLRSYKDNLVVYAVAG
jgi:hypothetical protein